MSYPPYPYLSMAAQAKLRGDASVQRIHYARQNPLPLVLDYNNNPLHASIKQIVAVRQYCIDDFFGANTDNRIHYLEMFEQCNEQIKLALGL